jgi:predicted acetyltransferase
MASFQAYGRAVDEALPWMLADPRRLRRSVRDEIWLRIVDVHAALSDRSYAQSSRLNIEVRDPICPWSDGVVELQGGPEGGFCRPTNESADLVLSASDLAATYLGTVRFATLLGAGRIEERTTGSVDTADAMFATRLQPWSLR